MADGIQVCSGNCTDLATAEMSMSTKTTVVNAELMRWSVHRVVPVRAYRMRIAASSA
jgi:hypothetical protein